MDSSTGNSNNNALWIAVGLIVAVCCACALIVGALGVVISNATSDALGTAAPYLTQFPIETLVGPTFTPSVVPTISRPPVDGISTNTLDTLKATLVPENDPYEIACRLQNICGVANTLPAPSTPLQVGAKNKFWVLNSNTNEHFQINATLKYITPHTYFWAEDGTSVNMSDLKRLMDTFENKIYPTDREFFGSEWTPGVDNDPHIYILYANNIGSTVAGYYNSSDEYNPAVHEYSNSHESFVIGADQPLNDEYTYTVLAHEFVHMIQFPVDRNDVSWIDEGFAEVGAFLNGYDLGGADQLFAFNPDLQLNDWADPNSPDFSAHYGASFLYLAYYLDRFGEEASKALTANPENDITSVDDTLASLNITDPLTGNVVTADDVFMDYAGALFLQDGAVGDGRYTFHNYPNAPQTYIGDSIYLCPSTSPLNASVHQYGIDYVGIKCSSGNYTLHFEGATVTDLLPVAANSGQFAFWSNKGDESDMTLTREFDLTGVSGPVTLSYDTWYDIEKDYDYVYLEVSEDGKSWTFLNTPSGTDTNPTGANLGWAYTSKSSGWIKEEVDLSAYAGKNIQVRFEYITDAAVDGEGFLVDDISIDAIGYSSDFESDDGGWEAKGFARVDNVLPQIFRLSLIVEHKGQITVQNIEVNADQTADIPLSIQSGDAVTLIVTGVTRFTRGLAYYSISIQ